MVCEVAHLWYNGTTVCKLTHWQLSTPLQKSCLIHSCTYNQNHNSPSKTSTSLSHSYRGHTNVTARLGLLNAYNTLHSGRISRAYAKNCFESRILSNLTNTRGRAWV